MTPKQLLFLSIFSGALTAVSPAQDAYRIITNEPLTESSIDLNNDGILDRVTGPGPGGPPHVKVYDGTTEAIISQWFAYPVSFTGGVRVAVGDIGNDGNFDVVTGAGPGGAPLVAVWDPYTGALLAQFMAFDESFTGGVFVAIGAVMGDNINHIIVGQGSGGSSMIKVFNFPTLDLLSSFDAFNSSTVGASVGVIDPLGNGNFQILTGSGAGMIDTVNVYSGLGVLQQSITPFGSDMNGVYVSSSVVVGAIPEPSTYAGIAGIGALGLALWKRKRGLVG